MNHPNERRSNHSLGSPQPSRRAVITGGGLGLAALALAGCEKQPPAPAATPGAARTTPPARDPQGLTTLDARLVAGDKLDPKKPYRRLALDGPQELVVREDLCRAQQSRATGRKTLSAFGHITDTHILDPTSPAHTTLTFLQNPASLQEQDSYFFRAQDSLTVQVMDTMVRKLNAVGSGPVTGRPFDFYISTGDASNNRGTNEVHAFIDVLNGDQASAFALPGKYTGLQAGVKLPQAMDRFIWQPVPPKGAAASNTWQKLYGFPTAGHLLSSAALPVDTGGATVPWYSGFGNHDQLAHGGTSALDTPLENFYAALATSDKLITGLPKGTDYPAFFKKLSTSTQPQIKAILPDMPGIRVKASSARRPVTKTEFMSAHWASPGPHGPDGHGFTAENLRLGTAYYRFALAEGIVGLMLDTTDPTGGGKGSLDNRQAAWLEEELQAASGSYWDAQGGKVLHSVPDQLVVLFSHHPSASFGTPRSASADAGALASPDAIHQLLGRFPNVILWVNGHYHRNTIWPRKSMLGAHGFWEVNTASHIDFPQQSRTVEIIDNNDGTLSIAGVMVDHSSPLPLDYSKPFSAAQLAAFSVELSLNSPAGKADSRRGNAKDQNVELLLQRPFPAA